MRSKALALFLALTATGCSDYWDMVVEDIERRERLERFEKKMQDRKKSNANRP